MVKQTAGRESLGDFAPKFAELNDDVLFGEVWSREDKLSLRDRSLVTVCIFIGKRLVDSSLKYHLINAKKNGITLSEILGLLILQLKYLEKIHQMNGANLLQMKNIIKYN